MYFYNLAQAPLYSWSCLWHNQFIVINLFFFLAETNSVKFGGAVLCGFILKPKWECKFLEHRDFSFYIWTQTLQRVPGSMLQVEFSEKQMISWSLVGWVFIRKCPWDWQLWKGDGSRTKQRERLGLSQSHREI